MKSEFKSITQPFSNKITINESDYLYFGGTAYLGIPQNKAFINYYIEGIKKYGLNNGTSRTNNIQLGIYNEAENTAALRFNSESALITSSGYLAAQLTVKALSKLGHVIYAPATHPALWLSDQQANNIPFSEWAQKTVNFINQSTEKNWIIISNSMNNLFPEIYDFTFLSQVDPNKSLILIIDDSHGIGVNNNGLSAYSTLPQQQNIQNVVVASMAKALGLDAGLILGSTEIISLLKNTNEFVGASPSVAPGLYAFIHAENIYREEWLKLQQNIIDFSKNLNSNWKFTPQFPAFYINDNSIAEKLLKENIFISSFPYPTKDSSLINRIVLSSWHTKEDIRYLTSTLNKI